MPILRVYYFSATLQPPRTKNTLSMRAPALQMPAWAPAWQQGFSTRGGTSLCRSVPSICPYFTKHQKHETTHFLSKLHSLILKCFRTPIVEYAAYLMAPCEDELELALLAFHLVILKYFQGVIVTTPRQHIIPTWSRSVLHGVRASFARSIHSTKS